MGILKHSPKLLFTVLFVWISFIPLPLQCRYPLQLKIFFLAGSVFLFIKHKRSIFKDSDWPLWLFLAAMSAGAYGVEAWHVAVATYLDLSIPIIFIYYLMAENFSFEENFVFLSRLICVFSIVVAFWGLLDVLLRVDLLYETFLPNPFYDSYIHQWPMRAIATQYHAPPLGTYLIASLPFSVLTMRQDRSLYKALGIVGVIMSIAVAMLTFSRGVFLSLFCMLLFILCVHKKAKWIFFLLVGLVTLMIVSVSLPYPFSKFGIRQIFAAADGIFASYRFERIQMLGRILKSHPFIGIGFQHVRLLFYDYYQGKGIVPYDYKIMDNMYFTLAAETGLIGFASFMILIGSMIVKGWRSFQGCYDTSEKTRLFYVWMGFFGLLINAMAYELFYWPSQYMLFCIYIGLIETFFRKSPARDNTKNVLKQRP